MVEEFQAQVEEPELAHEPQEQFVRNEETLDCSYTPNERLNGDLPLEEIKDVNQLPQDIPEAACDIIKEEFEADGKQRLEEDVEIPELRHRISANFLQSYGAIYVTFTYLTPL